MNYPPFSSRQPRGAALLLVLGAVAILSILAVELSHRSKLDVSRTERASREATFRRVFDSGIEIAKGLLTEGRKAEGFDFSGDKWNRTVTADLDKGQRVTVRMADESGKLNLLKAIDPTSGAKMRKSLARLFAYLRKSDSEREQQWKDAEAAIAKRLSLEGNAPPQPIYTLDALREAGIPAELIFGRADNAPEIVSLCDLLTTFGDGRVNLNTAPKAVLYALDDEYDESLVENINLWRGTLDSEIKADGDIKPFKSARDLEFVNGIVQRSVIDGTPVVVKNLFLKVQDSVSVQSACFSARIHAQVDGRQRSAWAFFEAPLKTIGAAPEIKLITYEEIEP